MVDVPWILRGEGSMCHRWSQSHGASLCMWGLWWGTLQEQDVLLRTSPAVVTILHTALRCTEHAVWETVHCSTITSICLAVATQWGTSALINAFILPIPSTISYIFFFFPCSACEFHTSQDQDHKDTWLGSLPGSLLACQGRISPRLAGALSKCQEGWCYATPQPGLALSRNCSASAGASLCCRTDSVLQALPGPSLQLGNFGDCCSSSMSLSASVWELQWARRSQSQS